MKLPCELVQDLLPLYHDEACSPTSAAMVAEHLQDCDPCRKMLEDMDAALDVPMEGVEAASGLKAIKKTWMKKLVRAFAIGVGVILLIVVALWLLYTWAIVPVAPEEILFTHRHYTEDDSLSYGYIVPYRQAKGHEYTSIDGELYIWYTRPVLSKNLKNRGTYSGVTRNIADSFIADDTLECVEPQAIYFGKPGADDIILLWEPGMELPGPEAAPAQGEIVIPINQNQTIDITE